MASVDGRWRGVRKARSGAGVDSSIDVRLAIAYPDIELRVEGGDSYVGTIQSQPNSIDADGGGAAVGGDSFELDVQFEDQGCSLGLAKLEDGGKLLIWAAAAPKRDRPATVEVAPRTHLFELVREEPKKKNNNNNSQAEEEEQKILQEQEEERKRREEEEEDREKEKERRRKEEEEQERQRIQQEEEEKERKRIAAEKQRKLAEEEEAQQRKIEEELEQKQREHREMRARLKREQEEKEAAEVRRVQELEEERERKRQEEEEAAAQVEAEEEEKRKEEQNINEEQMFGESPAVVFATIEPPVKEMEGGGEAVVDAEAAAAAAVMMEASDDDHFLHFLEGFWSGKKNTEKQGKSDVSVEFGAKSLALTIEEDHFIGKSFSLSRESDRVFLIDVEFEDLGLSLGRVEKLENFIEGWDGLRWAMGAPGQARPENFEPLGKTQILSIRRKSKLEDSEVGNNNNVAAAAAAVSAPPPPAPAESAPPQQQLSEGSGSQIAIAIDFNKVPVVQPLGMAGPHGTANWDPMIFEGGLFAARRAPSPPPEPEPAPQPNNPPNVNAAAAVADDDEEDEVPLRGGSRTASLFPQDRSQQQQQQQQQQLPAAAAPPPYQPQPTSSAIHRAFSLDSSDSSVASTPPPPYPGAFSAAGANNNNNGPLSPPHYYLAQPPDSTPPLPGPSLATSSAYPQNNGSSDERDERSGGVISRSSSLPVAVSPNHFTSPSTTYPQQQHPYYQHQQPMYQPYGTMNPYPAYYPPAVPSPYGAVPMGVPVGGLPESQRPVKTGVLFKRGHIFKNWKGRYVVLLPSCLLYFEDEASWIAKLKPKSTISLLRARVENLGRVSMDGRGGWFFSVTDTTKSSGGDANITFFEAANAAECTAWVEAIKSVISPPPVHSRPASIPPSSSQQQHQFSPPPPHHPSRGGVASPSPGAASARPAPPPRPFVFQEEMPGIKESVTLVNEILAFNPPGGEGVDPTLIDSMYEDLKVSSQRLCDAISSLSLADSEMMDALHWNDNVQSTLSAAEEWKKNAQRGGAAAAVSR